MNDDQRAAIEHACTRLSYEYARAIDFRDYDNFAELFATDGELEVGRTLSGRTAIQESLHGRPDELRSRHVITNVLIDVESASSARGTSYLSLYRHLGPESLDRVPIAFDAPAAIGHYEDRFICEGGIWLFKRRKLFLAFSNSALMG